MKLTVSFLVTLGFSIPCHTSDAFHAFPCCAYFSNSRGTTHGVACGVARVVLESCQFSLRPSYIVKNTCLYKTRWRRNTKTHWTTNYSDLEHQEWKIFWLLWRFEVDESWTGSVTLIRLLYFQFKEVRRQAMVLKNLTKARYAKDHFVSTHQARHKTKVEDKYSRAKLVQRTSTSMADWLSQLTQLADPSLRCAHDCKVTREGKVAGQERRWAWRVLPWC